MNASRPGRGHAATGRSPSGPRCSVVVPVRDDAVELRGLLLALERQEHPPFEIVVVDNGSSDDGAAVARAAGARVVTESAPGIPAAAATGYDAAQGDLIVRCDADSRPGPQWLGAHVRAHLLGGPATVLVTGPALFRLPRPLGHVLSLAYVGGYVAATAAALGHPPAFGTTMSMRRGWWRRVRDGVSRSADVHDDMDLSFRVGPAEHVRWARSVSVTMSPRALSPGRGFVLRWSRAARTLRRNWRLQRPWHRWADRLSAAGRVRPAGRGPAVDVGTRDAAT